MVMLASVMVALCKLVGGGQFMISGLSCSPLHVQDGETALFLASLKGHDQIVELLRREADVNHQTKVRPLMLVCVCVCVCSSTATLYIVLSLQDNWTVIVCKK